MATAFSFWYLSAPGNPSKQEVIQKLKDTQSKLIEVFPFNLPEFKASCFYFSFHCIESIST